MAKFVGDGDDELNAFITLETLSMGIEGKICMWRALGTVVDGYPALGSSTSTRAARASAPGSRRSGCRSRRGHSPAPPTSERRQRGRRGAMMR